MNGIIHTFFKRLHFNLPSMNKQFFFFLVVSIIFWFSTTAQVDYGLKAGTGNYDVNTANIDSNGNFPLSTHIGGFVGLQFNESLGGVLNVAYNNSEESYGFRGSDQFDIKINTVQIAGHLKFDVNKSYGEGFYLLVGPRISFVGKATDEAGQEIEEFYANTRFAAQLGFGINFLKYFGFEVIGDYGLSNILDAEDFEGNTAGGYVLLTVNLESILSK